MTHGRTALAPQMRVAFAAGWCLCVTVDWLPFQKGVKGAWLRCCLGHQERVQTNRAALQKLKWSPHCFWENVIRRPSTEVRELRGYETHSWCFSMPFVKTADCLQTDNSTAYFFMRTTAQTGGKRAWRQGGAWD